MKKYVIIWSVLSLLVTWAIFANNVWSVRSTIDWTIATWPYNNNITGWEWDQALRVVRWGSENWVGDYLIWSYIDPAHGRFTFPTLSESNTVTITSDTYNNCGNDYIWRMLTWQAQSDFFGPVDFSGVHICIPDEAWQLWSDAQAILWWTITSDTIWEKVVNASFWATQFDITSSDFRRLKVVGLTSSQSFRTFDEDQLSEVRVFWDISKPELRALMSRNVQNIVRNITPSWSSDIDIIEAQLSSSAWNIIPWTDKFANNEILYIWRDWGNTVNLMWGSLPSNSNKTLVVEWADIYIQWDIIWEGILGIVALHKNGQWGNIYIDNTVTDIHAFIYTDRSVMSVQESGSGFEILNGDSHENQLTNQLYIKWVLFSENTIWGANESPFNCPFYISSNTCDMSEAAQYDLNYLRRYYITESVNEDDEIILIPTGAQSGGIFDNSGNVREDFDQYPVILEYDNRIINDAPPLFSR